MKNERNEKIVVLGYKQKFIEFDEIERKKSFGSGLGGIGDGCDVRCFSAEKKFSPAHAVTQKSLPELISFLPNRRFYWRM